MRKIIIITVHFKPSVMNNIFNVYIKTSAELELATMLVVFEIVIDLKFQII